MNLEQTKGKETSTIPAPDNSVLPIDRTQNVFSQTELSLIHLLQTRLWQNNVSQSNLWQTNRYQTNPYQIRPTRIAIRAKRKILLIDPADVIAVEAQGNYVLVQQIATSHLLRESISTMEKKLDPHGFVRIHRSVLVNAACVEEIQPWSTGEYVLRAKGREYTVTRTYRNNLRQLAQLWIGTSAIFAE